MYARVFCVRNNEHTSNRICGMLLEIENASENLLSLNTLYMLPFSRYKHNRMQYPAIKSRLAIATNRQIYTYGWSCYYRALCTNDIIIGCGVTGPKCVTYVIFWNSIRSHWEHNLYIVCKLCVNLYKVKSINHKPSVAIRVILIMVEIAFYIGTAPQKKKYIQIGNLKYKPRTDCNPLGLRVLIAEFTKWELDAIRYSLIWAKTDSMYI